jgi:hypothetical protein
MEEILVIIIKGDGERGAVGTSSLTYLPQYDRFMRIGDKKGELLEMLLEKKRNPCNHAGNIPGGWG